MSLCDDSLIRLYYKISSKLFVKVLIKLDSHSQAIINSSNYITMWSSTDVQEPPILLKIEANMSISKLSLGICKFSFRNSQATFDILMHKLIFRKTKKGKGFGLFFDLQIRL